MLRININDEQTTLRLVLEGELMEPWITELQSIWADGARACHERKCILDLSSVTRVDENGKRLLAAMKQEGAEFYTSGVLMKHLIRGLNETGDRH